MRVYSIKTEEFRRLDNPHGPSDKHKYVCYVHIDHVPEDIPMATNPRDQKLTTDVAKDIEESLISNDGFFHLKNRGVVISAQSVEYDHYSKMMILKLGNDYNNGNIDGGHTYKILLKHKNTELDQYVQFEIMVGVEDIIEQLADARNNSNQVDDKSLAELSNKFAPVKNAIGGVEFYDRIAFKQNQQIEINGKKAKMIDAREVIAVISLFDKNKYPLPKHPTLAYSGKATILDEYLKDPNYFEVFTNIAKDIFVLYDTIEKDFPYAYNSTGGRYGAKNFSGYKEKDGSSVAVTKSKFTETPINYKVPDGIMYPVVASFRSLIGYDENTKKYFWKKNPFEAYQKHRQNIATKMMSYIDDIGNNPNAAGKNVNGWDYIYMTTERALLD